MAYTVQHDLSDSSLAAPIIARLIQHGAGKAVTSACEFSPFGPHVKWYRAICAERDKRNGGVQFTRRYGVEIGKGLKFDFWRFMPERYWRMPPLLHVCIWCADFPRSIHLDEQVDRWKYDERGKKERRCATALSVYPRGTSTNCDCSMQPGQIAPVRVCEPSLHGQLTKSQENARTHRDNVMEIRP